MHKIIELKSLDDLDQIVEALKAENEADPVALDAAHVVEELKLYLSNHVKAVLVEYPYVDKDYRSTYYNFYAKKSRRYSPFCARLHFFSDLVNFSSTLQLKTASGRELQEHYLGFMVVRPTYLRTVGRTILQPAALKDCRGHIVEANYSTHILGTRVMAAGFPFMKQHGDIAVCAHVACWSILRHFSERFPSYRELLTYDITRLGSPDSPGGIVPSRGLTYLNAATILAQAGAYPECQPKNAYKEPAMFYRLLYSYVESGLPIFAAMTNRRHAITVVGHGPVPGDAKPDPAAPISFAWDHIRSLLVADDNYFPYRLITYDKTNFHYTVEDIDYFVVPMPEKVYFTSEAVMAFTEKILTKKLYELRFAHIPQPVIRHFLTTSVAYKRFVLDNASQLPMELVKVTLELPLPQFIWVCEIATVPDWATGSCQARFVFDATAHTQEPYPFFLLHDQDKVVIFDRGYSGKRSELPFSIPAGKSKLYEENMRRY